MAVDLYASDHDTLYPRGASGFRRAFPIEEEPDATVVRALPPISTLLLPYTKSRDLWRCPLDDGLFGDVPLGPSVFSRYGESYSYLTALALGPVASPAQGVSLATGFAEYGPAQIVVLYDFSPRWHGDLQNGRHNALYADGHTRRITEAEETLGTGVVF